jgi:hypothetical protein
MPTDDLSATINALNQLEQSASLAQKYGPYFFAVALLVVAPFICRKIFQDSLHSQDADERQQARGDFRFYFRATVMLGVFCVLAGVGWWLFENYRENSRTVAQVAELKSQLQKIDAIMKTMNFATFGVISAGLPADDVLTANMFDNNMLIAFAKLPVDPRQPEAKWLFVVLSNQELPPTLNFNVGWQPHNITQSVPLQARLKLGKSKDDRYKFSPDQDPATIEPISN